MFNISLPNNSNNSLPHKQLTDYITNHFSVQTPEGLDDFADYPIYRRVLSDLEEFDKNVITKVRQIGGSTLLRSFAMYKMMWNNEYNVLYIGMNASQAHHHTKYLTHVLKDNSVYMKVENKFEVELDNGSKFRSAHPQNIDGMVRSERFNMVIVDEMAHMNKLSGMTATIEPAMVYPAKAVILSTPNKNSIFNEFYKTVTDNMERDEDEYVINQHEQKFNESIESYRYRTTGTNGWHPIHLHWESLPTMDQRWYKERKQNDIYFDLNTVLMEEEMDAEVK